MANASPLCAATAVSHASSNARRPPPALVCEILSSLASPRDLLLPHHAASVAKQRLTFLLPTSPAISDADLLVSLLWSSPPHPLLTPAYMQFVLADRYARGGSTWLEDDIVRSGRSWQRDQDTLEYLVPVDLRPDPGNPLHMMRIVLVLIKEEDRWKFLDLRVLPDAEWVQLSERLAAAARQAEKEGEQEADKNDQDQGNEEDTYWSAYESRTLPSKSSAQRLDVVNGEESDEEDAGYWGQYDSIRAPSPAAQPVTVPAPIHVPVRRTSSVSHAPVEPVMSPYGPTLADLDVPAVPAVSVSTEHATMSSLPPVSTTATANATATATATATVSVPMSKVDQTPSQPLAEVRQPVAKHVQATVKSLWDLASTSGISRQEFLVLVAASMDS
ncbi:hypothetical protein BCR44DRAFT_34061 [Catenaria anguillulae PL171]|uniref:Uncharacterized protein n=1 Tax=Catenaria anguillulae PL171 TaxID=765915 RepID=A0A1Y2HWX4_9FUNG|nr:hypothetical protein BCR44DRAFT_34061 [Catenaria anguillulae PL171]